MPGSQPSRGTGSAGVEMRIIYLVLQTLKLGFFFVVRSTDILLRASLKHERDPVLKSDT